MQEMEEGIPARSCISKNGPCQPGKWHGCFISVFNLDVCIGRGKYTYVSISMQLNLSEVLLRTGVILKVPY